MADLPAIATKRMLTSWWTFRKKQPSAFTAFNFISQLMTKTTAFLKHISHIFFMCSDPQMIRIYTRRVIASMANFPFSRYSSNSMQFPRYSMSGDLNAIAITNDSVPFLFSFLPYPAILNYFESLIESTSKTSVSYFSRTTFTPKRFWIATKFFFAHHAEMYYLFHGSLYDNTIGESI
jgi:hypothetical protein